LLIASLLAMSGIVVTLLGLITAGRLDVWSLLLATTLWGVLWAIHQPAQQAIQADVLSGRDLVHGIALMNTAMNLISILGPALAGALLACCGAQALSAAGGAGVWWSYLVLLGLHLLQLWHYSAMRLVQQPPTAARTSVWQNLVAGMRYSYNNPGLWTALVLAGMVNMVAFPLQFGLLPIFARDVFHVGAAGLGLLGSALGIGSLLGSLLMAGMGAVQRAGRLMLAGTIGWLVLLILFALTPAYTMALGLLVLMGVAQTFSLTNMTVLLLGTASSDMRGRVMGLRSLAVAPLFVGGTLAGAATTWIGAPLTTIACAVIGLLIVLWVAPRIPRRMET
jgi:predicted MFS family arabinose efflux permease